MEEQIRKEFIPYEQALELKELGLDEPCLKEFHKQNLLSNSTGEEITNTQLIELYGEQDVISAPTYSQVFRFFREKHNLNHIDKLGMLIFEYAIPYEEAELACLKNLIDIVKLSGL